MIAVLWEGRSVAWFGPDELTVSPWSPDALQEVREHLRQPVELAVSEEEAGIIGEAIVILEPGTPQHARAALLTLPGHTVLVADG